MSSLPKGFLSSGTRRGWARTGAAVPVLAAALVLLVRPASVARAEQPLPPSLVERVAQLEAELDALADALAAETAAREAAEAALQAALDAEAVARAGGDAGLQTGLNQETADRTAADDALYLQACAYTDGEIETALGGLDPAELAALSADLDAVEETLAPFSTVADGAGGYDVYVTAANLHIENGLGITNSTNGLGNLFVGYNELESRTEGDRTGSHNLVVGPGHGYVSYGGLIAGWHNYVSGKYSSVSGGYVNTASGVCSSVSGGAVNTASAYMSSVSGGSGREATDDYDWAAGYLWVDY